jgi:hypothetical protein
MLILGGLKKGSPSVGGELFLYLKRKRLDPAMAGTRLFVVNSGKPNLPV